MEGTHMSETPDEQLPDAAPVKLQDDDEPDELGDELDAAPIAPLSVQLPGRAPVYAVYDNAELRFVGDVTADREACEREADELRASNGRDYVVQEV